MLDSTVFEDLPLLIIGTVYFAQLDVIGAWLDLKAEVWSMCAIETYKLS